MKTTNLTITKTIFNGKLLLPKQKHGRKQKDLKDQQVQFLIYLKKFQLIVETHLLMQLILCEIKDRLYVPPSIT